MTSRVSRLLAVMVLPFALVSCADDEKSTPAAAPSPGGSPTLTGSVVKGVTANAIVTITGADGTLLATTESSALGAYSITLPEGYTGAVKIVATAKQDAASLPPEERTQMRCDAPTGGCKDANGNTVAFGQWFEVPLDFQLSAVMAVNGWGIHFANVTPLSTLAAEWAATFPQGLTADVANDANSTMAAMFGLALTDLENNTSDIADATWLQMASPQQVQLALLYATFAEINAQYGMPMQQLVDLVSDYFVGQGGALVEVSSGPEPSVAFLVTLADQLLDSPTIAGVLDFPGSNYNEVQASMDTLLAGLDSGELTAIQPVTFQYFVGKLGPMGAQLDELLGTAGMLDVNGEIDLVAFINAQKPAFGWLVHENNLKLVPVAAEAVVAVALSSLWLDIADPNVTDIVMPGSIKDPADEYGQTYFYKINLNVPSKTLTLQGVTRGQTVDLTIDVTGMLDAMDNPNQRFSFHVAGTVSNATAAGQIDAQLTIDPKNMDFDSLLALLNPLKEARLIEDVEQRMQAVQVAMINLIFGMPALLQEYAYTVNAEVWAQGSASLISKEDTTQSLAGDFELLGFVDLAATGAQKLAWLDLKTFNLDLPALSGQVNSLYPNGGKHVLRVDLTQDLDVTVDGAAQLFGVPEAVLHATGKVTNARLLFDHVRSVLTGGFLDGFNESMSVGSLDLATLADDLLAFDQFDQMHATGEAQVTIPGLTGVNAAGHDYRATLNDTVVTVYQPFSNEVAFTAELMVDRQKVHFRLGADQEPWDLRVMTTPTPRLALLGPAGQYADMTQEDVYSLLDTLQLRDLLDTFVTELFAPPT